MYHTFINDEKLLAITTYGKNSFSKNNSLNYDKLSNSLGINTKDIYLPNQTHSDYFEEVTTNKTTYENTDALYTKEKGIYIGVLTADCLPILLYAPDREIVGAIHSGWIGSTKIITYKLISYLIIHEKIDPTQLKIFIGPSISSEKYEVSQDVYDKIKQHEFIDYKKCFIELGNEKYLYDNRLFNLLLLDKLNILKENITILDKCTFQSNDLFSYRQNKDDGRQLSLIGMK